MQAIIAGTDPLVLDTAVAIGQNANLKIHGTDQLLTTKMLAAHLKNNVAPHNRYHKAQVVVYKNKTTQMISYYARIKADSRARHPALQFSLTSSAFGTWVPVQKHAAFNEHSPDLLTLFLMTALATDETDTIRAHWDTVAALIRTGYAIVPHIDPHQPQQQPQPDPEQPSYDRLAQRVAQLEAELPNVRAICLAAVQQLQGQSNCTAQQLRDEDQRLDARIGQLDSMMAGLVHQLPSSPVYHHHSRTGAE